MLTQKYDKCLRFLLCYAPYSLSGFNRQLNTGFNQIVSRTWLNVCMIKKKQLLLLHTHSFYKCSKCIRFIALAAEIPSDTKVSLLHLKELFPLERFEGRLPVVTVKHQLYSLISDRTAVDKELVSWFLSNIFFMILDIKTY